MKILFDARAAQGWSDGMSNYVRHLLMGLLRADTDHEYVLLLHPVFRDELMATGLLDRPNIHAVTTRIPFMGGLQQFQIPSLLKRYPDVALYHYPHFDMPLLAHPRSVVTIYDLNHIALPGYFDSQRSLKRLYSYWTTRCTVSKATHVMTISNTSKNELLKRFPWLDAQKISVIYFGLDRAFVEPPEPAQIERFRQKFSLGPHRFILYVGTHRPHKNLDRLLDAYQQLRRQTPLSHKLLLVGASKNDGHLHQKVRERGLVGSVAYLGYLTEDDLSLAYRVADVFAFCSLSEGFGMPILEAMASGVPVVTSNWGAMAEVAGDSAVLVDSFSSAAITEGLCRVLTSEELRQRLIERGRERIRRFTWEESVRKTLDVYEMAGHGSSTREAKPPQLISPCAGS